MWYILFSLLLFACNDYGVNKIIQTDPELVVYPEIIEFGHLQSGLESGQATFAVINAGDEELIMSHPELISETNRFSLEDNLEENYTIAPGGTQEFVVYYEPKTFENNDGLIRFVTNDEDENQYELPVTGFGDAPVMTVTPEVFDYGQISIGCDNEERITIRNRGNLLLSINNITQMVTQPQDIVMEMGNLPPLPWELLPGQEIDFLVSYIPIDISYDESVIRIEGNDPALPTTEVVQYGEGDVEHWYSQTWQQEEIPVLDVLWVIDNSGSMNQFQTSLSTNISSFMAAFSQTGADYNMAVIATDRYMISTILTPQTPNVEQELGNLVIQGTYGSGMEKGIEMSYKALSSATSAGPGSIFFRESATLVVIYVSDEQDWSNPGWSHYTNFFDTLKPRGQFIPYGVISDVPGGCQYTTFNGLPRSLQPGIGYWDLIDYYNGSWYSICATDWGVQLQDLAGEVTGRRMFELEEPDPIMDTIEVTVNGQTATMWEYDEVSNSVIFDEGSVPLEGQTIRIDYAVLGCGNE